MTDVDSIKSGIKQAQALSGEWKTMALINGTPLVSLTTKFEWIESGGFIAQQIISDPPLPTTPFVWIENNPHPVTAVISFDDFSRKYYYNYADARGVRRVYQMSFNNSVWKFWGQAGPKFFQRFEGKISADGNFINAKIEKSSDGKKWELDFDLKYEKIINKR